MDREDVEDLGSGGTEGKPGDPAGGTEPQLPRPPIPPERTEQLLNEAKRRLRAAGTLEEVSRIVPPPPPRTGVGAFDASAEPAGMSLGGDAGDVSVPRLEISAPGDTHGASATPDASTVVPPEEPRTKTYGAHLAREEEKPNAA